jgi:tRNA pseudouridine-54 N-methylase
MAKNVRLHPLIRERLGELQKALDREVGVTATQEEIIGALVYANTVAQLAGILPVYKRYAADADGTEASP